MNIFINYRRNDTKIFATIIYEKILKHINNSNVFLDIDTIEPGENFINSIIKTIDKCQLMLSLIGPNWIKQDEKYGTNIKNPHDFVQLEIHEALKRNIKIIPILINDASMPKESDLPCELHSILKFSALSINEATLETDINSFIYQLLRIKNNTFHSKEIVINKGILFLGVIFIISVFMSVILFSNIIF